MDTHFDFYAFVELLAGSRDGLRGAELKVPQLVLHPAETRSDSFEPQHPESTAASSAVSRFEANRWRQLVVTSAQRSKHHCCLKVATLALTGKTPASVSAHTTFRAENSPWTWRRDRGELRLLTRVNTAGNDSQDRRQRSAQT